MKHKLQKDPQRLEENYFLPLFDTNITLDVYS